MATLGTGHSSGGVCLKWCLCRSRSATQSGRRGQRNAVPRPWSGRTAWWPCSPAASPPRARLCRPTRRAAASLVRKRLVLASGGAGHVGPLVDVVGEGAGLAERLVEAFR